MCTGDRDRTFKAGTGVLIKTDNIKNKCRKPIRKYSGGMEIIYEERSY